MRVASNARLARWLEIGGEGFLCNRFNISRGLGIKRERSQYLYRLGALTSSSQHERAVDL